MNDKRYVFLQSQLYQVSLKLSLLYFIAGTYNNQYMILDRNKFIVKETIMDNALWIVEQIPTLVVSKDETNVLRAGQYKLFDMYNYNW